MGRSFGTPPGRGSRRLGPPDPSIQGGKKDADVAAGFAEVLGEDGKGAIQDHKSRIPNESEA
jgi:hypothetical protein